MNTLGTSLPPRCDAPNGDCELVGAIVAAAISAWPESASAIDDAALAIAPDCADAIQNAAPRDAKDVPGEGPDNFSAPPTNQAPLPGAAGGGGGFDPGESTVVICDKGRQRSVRASRVSHFLDIHPGSFLGSRLITPGTSR
jgi:hypothetical protein